MTDLAAAVWGPEPISFRRLELLVHGLPVESQTARQLGAPVPGMPGQWGNAEELLAAVVEVLGDFRNVYIKSRPRPKGTAAPNPKPLKIPRPASVRGQDGDRPKPATAGELAAFLGARGVQIDYTPPARSEGP